MRIVSQNVRVLEELMVSKNEGKTHKKSVLDHGANTESPLRDTFWRDTKIQSNADNHHNHVTLW